MTYPPEHTTDFDNDEWINGLDREEDIEEEKFYCKEWNNCGYVCEKQCERCRKTDDFEMEEDEWTPRQRAEYDYQIDLENGDYD